MEEMRRPDLRDMCRQHFNEPMLSFGELVRCVGYAESGVDCYVIVKRAGGERRWNTCVGGYVFLDRLQGQAHVKSSSGEDWDDLYRLSADLERSGATAEPEFIHIVLHDHMELGRPA